MKFSLQPPAKQETISLNTNPDKNEIEFEPVVVKGTHIIKAAYVAAKGDGGVESKAVILFNGRTGQFSIQQTDAEPPTLDFDLPKAKFEQKREAAKSSGAKGQKARSGKGDKPAPPAPQGAGG